MNSAAMVLVALVFVALVALVAAALWLNTRVDDARERFRVLTGGYGDADLLAGARQRFRERQRKLETAVDTGTTGLETVHRSFSRAFGGRRNSGAGVYAWMRGFNHGVGRTVSGVFAPGPRQRSESLEEWRARQQPPHGQDRHED